MRRAMHEHDKAVAEALTQWDNSDATEVENMTVISHNLLECAVVIAQFPNSPDKDYAYFVPEGDKPEVGDVILTSTSWDTFDAPHAPNAPMQAIQYQNVALGVKLARIIEVIPEGGHPKATRFYMQLMSIKALKATHDRNQTLAKRAKEIADASRQLDKLMARRSRIDIYREFVAKSSDPEAQKLLALIEGKSET